VAQMMLQPGKSEDKVLNYTGLLKHQIDQRKEALD